MPAGVNTGTARNPLDFLELYADYKPAHSSNRQLMRDLARTIRALSPTRSTEIEGLAGDSVTADGAKFNQLVNVTMQPNGGRLIVSGIPRLDVGFTIPSNIRLEFEGGAYLAPDAGVTVRLNCRFDRGNDQKFGGAGTITFGYGKLSKIKPQWWGGKPDISGHEDSGAIRAAIAAAVPLGASQPVGTVWLQCRGEWQVTDPNPIVISNPYTKIYGGKNQFDCNVRYTPGVAGVLFQFEGAHAGSPLYGCAIEGITFLSGNATYKKTAVQAVDVSSFVFRNNFASGWIGAKSTILSYSGRDMMTLEGNHLYADRPIEFLANAYAPTLALDHLHMTNNELVCKDAAEYCLAIGDNVGMSNVNINGFLACAGGRGGIFYEPTVGPGANLEVNISGFRYESPQTVDFQAISWGGAGVTTRLFSLRDSNLGGTGIVGTNRGLKLRQVTVGVIDNVIYSGGNVPLDVDNTCRDIMWNGFFVASVLTAPIIGANLINMLFESQHGGMGMPCRGHYINTADITNPAIKFGHKINLAVLAADPANLADGDVWFVAGGLKYRKGGLTIGPVT